MAYKETLERLYALKSRGISLGLDNITELMLRMKNPHRNFKSIHVGGTNGKGTTATFIANILREEGWKVGLYLSPHVYNFRERIMLNGEMIPEKKLEKLASDVLKFNFGTFFEVLTAMAFKYFSDEKVDYAVVEVGLGGRLDATNIINPEVAAITNVDMEHSDLLGKNLRAIAKEKAGIIKIGTKAITGENKREPLDEFKKVCKVKKVPLYLLGEYVDYEIKGDDRGSSLKVKHMGQALEARLKMVGEHHGVNSAIAVGTAKLSSANVSDESIIKGLEKTILPGRFEVKERNPYLILDGAHNPAAIDQVSRATYLLKYDKLICVTGMMNDKAIERMAEQISSFSDKVIITQPKLERAADPKYIQVQFKNVGVKAEIIEDVPGAIKHAKKIASKKDAIIVLGSFYLVAETMGCGYDVR